MQKRKHFSSEARNLGILLAILLVISLLWLKDIEKIYVGLYIFVCGLFYKLKIFLTERGCLERLWEKHVRPRKSNSLFFAVLVIFIDTIQMLIALSTSIIIISVFVFFVEKGHGLKNWWPTAFQLSVVSAGIGKIGNLGIEPVTKMGHFLCFLNFFAGLIFISLWIAIWSNAFENVFDYFKKDKGK